MISSELLKNLHNEKWQIKNDFYYCVYLNIVTGKRQFSIQCMDVYRFVDWSELDGHDPVTCVIMTFSFFFPRLGKIITYADIFVSNTLFLALFRHQVVWLLYGFETLTCCLFTTLQVFLPLWLSLLPTSNAHAQWEVRLFSWVYLVFIRHGLKQTNVRL